MGLQDKIKNAKETPWMGYYRPKEVVIYRFGTTGTATITCHPRSKWLCIGCGDRWVELTNHSVRMLIKVEDFNKIWVRCKEDHSNENR